MNKKEINTFIEKMESIGDLWTSEQVQKVYGDKSLEDALLDRKRSINMHLDNIVNIFSSLAGKDDK